MPNVNPQLIDLNDDVVTLGRPEQMDDAQREELCKQLKTLPAWRKGPFELFGLRIDTEWRSDLKWARLKDAVDPLEDRVILDVGCGNGYYLCRMLGAGAKAAVGVDPFMLYVVQFFAINRYLQTDRASVLPLGVEDLPVGCECFDTVFSMGILYHRRYPKGHLQQLHGFLRPGGQLVLETLVLDEKDEKLLVPDDRYGKMRNVWAIASPALLEKWLREAGFTNIRTIDITKTTNREQRKTKWMSYESLDDFLDPEDDGKTIEGYPAPVRGIFIANK